MEVKTGKNISIKIDGNKFSVPDGITVLEAARLKNVYIPTLCWLENLVPYGGCRLCVVEIKNMRGYPTACTTPVANEMEITTNTQELISLRKETLELILSEHPYSCLVCKDKNDCTEYMHTTRKVSTTTGCNYCTKNGDCELQNLVEYLELSEIKFPITYRQIEPERNNPFYDIDYNLCILCGRCVRICNEERNSEVLSFIQRGNHAIVGTAFGESQMEAGCEFCGACVDVCPTGSISEKMGKWVGLPDRSTETTCLFCPVGCSMNVNTKNNRIINVGSKAGERTNPLQLCVRGKFVPGDIVHHPDRVLNPLIRKGNKWIEVSWKEAISFTAEKLKQYVGEKFGMIGSPHDYLEDNYILQKFTRKVMRSNNLDMLSAYPNSEILEKIHEHNNTFPPIEIDSIKDSDTILIIGSNGSVSHPIIENRIRKAYRNGTKIIFANPENNRTSPFSHNTLIFKNGRELLLLHTILSGLLRNRNGEETKNLKLQLKGLDFNSACNQLGISDSQVKSAVKLISDSKKLLIIAGDGILRGSNCIESFNALYNLQLLQKYPDNCRIMFLLSEGNYYGGTFAGMNPELLPGFEKPDNKKSLKKWSDHLKIKLNKTPGLSLDQMINNKGKDGIEALFVVGNIPGSHDLSGLKFFVQQNMFLTDISKYAHVFLPTTNFLETRGHIINIERKIKKLKQVIKAQGEARTPWKTLSMLAQAMGIEGFNIKKPEDIYEELQSQTDLSFSTNNKLAKTYLPVKITPFKKIQEHIVKESLEYNYLHYSGNDLATYIEDFKEIKEG
ncbi:MAG: molybdopterin-dependent oxidoreductase [Bacteroidales bacterium]|nr:molybdopterin-dependent oxidoreductase [Bacteroidales bacterium]